MRWMLALAAVLLTFGCSPLEAPDPAVTVIVGAEVLDGSGAESRKTNLRFQGDRILSLSDAPPADSEIVVDASGLSLAPGFIDTHSHADPEIFAHRDALAAVSQGITTVVVGQDGGSPFPLSRFFADIERETVAVNVASYVGHGTVRRRVMGEDFRRAANEEEVARMRQLVSEEMKEGALGLATGLEYDPGIYSETAEVIELAREAASWGGQYISHMRSEDRYFWEAVEEILEVGKTAQIPVQISHVKLAMRSLHGKTERLITRLDQARADGIEVTADIYPYPYWQSTLTVLFPERDFDNRTQAELAVTEITTSDGMLIPTYLPEPSYEGKTLAEIAKSRGEDPATTLIELIREAERLRQQGEKNVESVIATSMDEADIAAMMAWPHTNLCTDGAFMGAHPRGFGSFPRFLGRYVRKQGILTVAEAVHKLTGLSAQHMGFADRGRLAEGYQADLVLFDPERVIDRATPEEPHALSEGIEKVWVNGVVVFEEKNATGAYPGEVLRRSSPSSKIGTLLQL